MKILEGENDTGRCHILTKDILWDIVIIGGGATGLGTALDAASRGYTTLLLEQSDFAKGTSSRSTKLVHGGVRYLAQGNLGLVFHALKERGLLLKNAPHLVKKQKFIIPCYSRFSILKYLIGLKIYDWMAGRYSFGKSKFLSKEQVVENVPGIKADGLYGGVVYYDGQFDDARLAINITQTARENGAELLNYIKIVDLIKNADGEVSGVSAIDQLTNKEYIIRAKTVINATGVFVDNILKMDAPEMKPIVRPSQGVHIVLPPSFLGGSSALMIPKTSDGRVLFAVPWHDHLLVGTTDTPLNESSIEPIALKQEIDFILKTAGQYLQTQPVEGDVLSVFAGLRPLAAPNKDTNSTKEISRDHKLLVATSGLITITGGKWTTYRQMAEETVDRAIKVAGLAYLPCSTKNIAIHGSTTLISDSHLSVYGEDEKLIRSLILENPELGEKLNGAFPYLKAEVIWAARHENVQTVEDILARRLRILFLNAKAAVELATPVASLLAREFGYDQRWEEDQVQKFREVAKGYLPPF
jgi:glycerol-3-phosphate dehydrogenase